MLPNLDNCINKFSIILLDSQKTGSEALNLGYPVLVLVLVLVSYWYAEKSISIVNPMILSGSPKGSDLHIPHFFLIDSHFGHLRRNCIAVSSSSWQRGHIPVLSSEAISAFLKFCQSICPQPEDRGFHVSRYGFFINWGLAPFAELVVV